jgi:hypothetical protein
MYMHLSSTLQVCAGEVGSVTAQFWVFRFLAGRSGLRTLVARC